MDIDIDISMSMIITKEQQIFFARQKAMKELKENNISFKDGFNNMIDFILDETTYSYNPINNRIYRGVYNSGLTLKKFLKAINNNKEIIYE